MEQWRLIIDRAYDGATNMALDEAILESVGRSDTLPTLRLYSWTPACLSLGYAQRSTDVDMDRLQARGWHLVRRMTGGRAILHTDELTYSVTLPLSHPLAEGSITDSYRRISAALLEALQQIGLNAHADQRPESKALPVGPVCFEIPSDYEITAYEKKLIGSAQVRKYDAVLQHGSLPLTGDITRICDALVFPDETSREIARARVAERAITLSEAIGREISWDEAAESVMAAFASTFNLDLIHTELAAEELSRAAELHESHYTAELWTQKR